MTIPRLTIESMTTASGTTYDATRKPFSLSLLLPLLPQISTAWVSDQQARGDRVARYRRYVEGRHDAKLSREMRQLLRLADSTDEGLNLNYMPIVVQTKVDRCVLQMIEAEAPEEMEDDGAASSWVNDLLEMNRIDGMQGEVHEAAIRDGDSFVMVSYDEETERARFTLEEAFDGEAGMLMVYPSKHMQAPICAIKIWHVMDGDNTQTRINLYFPDRVEKYQSVNGAALARLTDDPGGDWTDRAGRPLGIPVIHFRNAGRANYGQSEIANVIAPQNALNRFNYSAVAAAEYSGFPILVAMGFEPNGAITPGSIVKIGAEGLTSDQKVDFRRIEAGDLSQIVNMIHMMRASIADISMTPATQFADAATSGEALKQREIGLLGKAKRFMVRAGNSWEDCAAMAWRVEATFAPEQPPVYRRFYARWRSPEIRNDEAVVKNAMALREVVGDRQTLRLVAPIYDLDEDSIEKIMQEKTDEAARRISVAGGLLPTFENFQQPPVQTMAAQPPVDNQQEQMNKAEGI